jgi:hypothetical protein
MVMGINFIDHYELQRHFPTPFVRRLTVSVISLRPMFSGTAMSRLFKIATTAVSARSPTSAIR